MTVGSRCLIHSDWDIRFRPQFCIQECECKIVASQKNFPLSPCVFVCVCALIRIVCTVESVQCHLLQAIAWVAFSVRCFEQILLGPLKYLCLIRYPTRKSQINDFSHLFVSLLSLCHLIPIICYTQSETVENFNAQNCFQCYGCAATLDAMLVYCIVHMYTYRRSNVMYWNNRGQFDACVSVCRCVIPYVHHSSSTSILAFQCNGVTVNIN